MLLFMMIDYGCALVQMMLHMDHFLEEHPTNWGFIWLVLLLYMARLACSCNDVPFGGLSM